MFRMRSALIALLLLPSLAAAETVVVQMTTVAGEPRFVPEELDIRPGDTVRWVNTDAHLEHAVSSGTGSADPLSGSQWASSLLGLGEFFEHTFAQVGNFEYYSVPHEYEGMFGIIHVGLNTGVPGGLEPDTWGRIKQNFANILPRQ